PGGFVSTVGQSGQCLSSTAFLINLRMKLVKTHPEDHQLSYDALREVVRTAWEAVPESFLSDLIESMQARCQAVIEADGGHTKYWNTRVRSTTLLGIVSIFIPAELIPVGPTVLT